MSNEPDEELPDHLWASKRSPENIATHREVTSVVPAPPACRALYQDDKGVVFAGDAVHYFGTWRERDVAFRDGRPTGRRSRWRCEAGPLVLVDGVLQPAPDSSNYDGVMIGDVVESCTLGSFSGAGLDDQDIVLGAPGGANDSRPASAGLALHRASPEITASQDADD